MIDREARSKTAALLRHFVAGRIANEEMCDNLPRSRTDGSVNEIEAVLQTGFEDIFCRPYRLGQPKPLPREQRRELARIAMFLYTDLSTDQAARYSEQPALRQWLHGFACLLALPLLIPYGICRSLWDWICIKLRFREASEDYWPFRDSADYHEALKRPKLLCGSRRV